MAALHGDPKRAALGEEKFELAEQQANAAAQAPKKESWQRTVLDSLVSGHSPEQGPLPHQSACLRCIQASLYLQVCTILSQNTTDVNSARAFAQLKKKFPVWELVRTASNGASRAQQVVVNLLAAIHASWYT